MTPLLRSKHNPKSRAALQAAFARGVGKARAKKSEGCTLAKGSTLARAVDLLTTAILANQAASNVSPLLSSK